VFLHSLFFVFDYEFRPGLGNGLAIYDVGRAGIRKRCGFVGHVASGVLAPSTDCEGEWVGVAYFESISLSLSSIADFNSLSLFATTSRISSEPIAATPPQGATATSRLPILAFAAAKSAQLAKGEAALDARPAVKDIDRSHNNQKGKEISRKAALFKPVPPYLTVVGLATSSQQFWTWKLALTMSEMSGSQFSQQLLCMRPLQGCYSLNNVRQ